MKIAIGADHAGFPVKENLRQSLGKEHSVEDFGSYGEESCDYPDFAIAVAYAVANGKAERGILICGTGIGMSIAANKVRGVRAALCFNEDTARLSRLHNDANILCLGGRTMNLELIEKVVQIWLCTSFEGGRHGQRIEKIKAVER